jgi:Fe-S cluster assembly protein SufD
MRNHYPDAYVPLGVTDLAQVTVGERHVALADDVYWTNAVTEVAVADGARVEYYRVQSESRRAYHVATTHTTQGRDSVLGLHPITLGAGLSRHDISTSLAGSGAQLVLNGFYLLRGRQHADHHTVIEHAQPHCTSHEYFNGILGEQAHGVFTGRIIVRPGAQRTDSKQTNSNLQHRRSAGRQPAPARDLCGRWKCRTARPWARWMRAPSTPAGGGLSPEGGAA